MIHQTSPTRPAAASTQAHLPEGSELFEALQSKRIAVADVQVPELFRLASTLASAGELKKKNLIYSDWIRSHPQTGPVDLQRVEINEADWLRRSGMPEEALASLKKLKIESHPLTQVEFLQAVNQCLCQLAQRTDSVAERIALLTTAAGNQQELVNVVLESGQFAADKKLYYLVGLCEHRRFLMQAQGLKSDAAIENAHRIAQCIVECEAMSPGQATRAAWELPFERGLYYEAADRYAEALPEFLRMWKVLKEVGDRRAQTGAALHCLYCVQNGAGLEPQEAAEEPRKFLLENGIRHLLPGDIPLFREQIKAVKECAGE